MAMTGRLGTGILPTPDASYGECLIMKTCGNKLHTGQLLLNLQNEHETLDDATISAAIDIHQ